MVAEVLLHGLLAAYSHLRLRRGGGACSLLASDHTGPDAETCTGLVCYLRGLLREKARLEWGNDLRLYTQVPFSLIKYVSNYFQ